MVTRPREGELRLNMNAKDSAITHCTPHPVADLEQHLKNSNTVLTKQSHYCFHS
jgi:hypothetical protein